MKKINIQEMELEKGPKVSLTLESSTSHSYLALSLSVHKHPEASSELLSCQGVGDGGAIRTE